MTLTAPLPDLRTGERVSAPPESPASAFARDGFVGPVRLCSALECRTIAEYLQRTDVPAPAEWEKGRAVSERFLFDVAVHPRLLSLLTSLLGDDVVLWGASVVRRKPGVAHPWHSDIESARPDGRFVSVWIGIENTSRESALQLITRSHRLGRSVQEVRAQRGLRREQATPEAMLAYAREQDPAAELVQPDMTNGDALLFDGRLWHGSVNTRKSGPRSALLLQYAAADCPVRMPDFSQLDWPFRFRQAPQPPAILVAGSDRSRVNRLVPPPPPSARGGPMVVTAIHRFDLQLEPTDQPWQPHPAFRGPTRTLADMACHASVLAGGHSPHPPHAHPEEELLIPLHGEVELRIADTPDDPAPRLERIRPGAFVYYPAGQHHTIRNPGAAPVAYLMFKWRSARTQPGPALPTSLFRFDDVTKPAGAAPFWTHRIFEHATAHLGKLHAHLTVLAPGAGYEPHVDAYDVAIVLLSGTVESLGERVEPMSVIYCAAGEPHGMRNVGAEPARYLVFEFHRVGGDPLPGSVPLHRKIKRRLASLARRLLHRA